MGQTIYFLNPCEKRNMLLILLAIFIQVWVLTPVQPVTLNIWPTQQLQIRTNFSIIILIYAYKNIQKVILLELVQGYIGYMSYLPSTISVVDARWGDTEDASLTRTCHLSLDSARCSRWAPLWVVHSFTLSNHDFFCLPLLRIPWMVPWRIVFAKESWCVTWPYQVS